MFVGMNFLGVEDGDVAGVVVDVVGRVAAVLLAISWLLYLSSFMWMEFLLSGLSGDGVVEEVAG